MPGAFAPQARAGIATPRSGKAGARGGRSARAAAGGAHALPRIRWDRLGRLAMLFVLAALLYLYLSAGIHMLSTWHQAHRDSATVVSMEREHKALVREHEALGRQGTVEAEARRLGMKRAGEQQYVITGLPPN